MLSNPYTIAYDLFLDLSGLKKPTTFNSKTVDLFLLVCEIASMPSIAYPDGITDFSQFCDDYHPGARFTRICTAIAKKPSLALNLNDSSKRSYIATSQGICDYLNWDAPQTVFEKILIIENNTRACMDLKQEIDSLYTIENPTIGLLLRRHFDHIKDRFEYPHRFCWPSKFMVRELGNNEDFNIQRKIDEKHCPIFTSKGLDGNARYVPPIDSPPDKERDQMVSEGFIRECCLRDLVDQLVCEYGEFRLDLSWVRKSEGERQLAQMKSDILKEYFGRNESDFGYLYKRVSPNDKEPPKPVLEEQVVKATKSTGKARIYQMPSSKKQP